MNITKAQTILRENKIPFDIRYGRGRFHYTALVFSNKSLAYKSLDIIGINCSINDEMNGEYSIIFYN